MTLASPLGGGGLGPSNKAAAPRALLLIAVAVIIGLVLLWKGVDTTPGTESSAEVAVDNSLGAVSTHIFIMYGPYGGGRGPRFGSVSGGIP